MGPSASDLRIISLFHGFADAELDKLGALFERVEIDPSTPLFEVGEPATDLYLLTTGSVTLDRPEDDLFRLSPPALIGELGALTGLPRSTRATVEAGSVLWSLPARRIQDFFADHQEMGVRFLINLLSVVADKVHRDQNHMADMRRHLVQTQKELKRVRDLILDEPETPISAPVHDVVDQLITRNRRVNYRVQPPPGLAITVRLETGVVPVADISRTHVTLEVVPAPVQGTWVSGVMALAGTEIPVSGHVMRVEGKRATLELDLLIDEYAVVLEGYLTRAQLLDILC